ncbi:MAG: 30S ribosomal protein S17 [Deltaproteobacteria bacterium CG11_big_fil_rev_8_21_14_0_20_45_16]|nr:MAG: 30S ribosomal protein S17 [Deltaproteobacteria bacterium CG11_big_fil_rev_8_21_14_0_20_45_16]
MSANSEIKTQRRAIVGTVIGNKMDKTIVVQAASLTKHPKYGKYYKSYKKYKAHDEKNECGIGDQVLIVESRPISKEKRFRLNKIVEKAKQAG